MVIVLDYFLYFILEFFSFFMFFLRKKYIEKILIGYPKPSTVTKTTYPMLTTIQAITGQQAKTDSKLTFKRETKKIFNNTLAHLYCKREP